MVVHARGARSRLRLHLVGSGLALALVALGQPACKHSGGGAAVDGGVGQTCQQTADCGEGLVCSSGRCIEAGTVGLGGDCWASRDCKDGLYCSAAGQCGPAGHGAVGDACGTAAECEPGLYCDVFGLSGTCAEPGSVDVDGACSTTSDCIAGLVCGPDGRCEAPVVAYPPWTGVACADDASAFEAYFEVPRAGAPLSDFYRLPFPSDARVSAAGALDLSDFPRPGPGLLGVDIAALYADALEADFAGFSPVAPVALRMSGELDFDTTSADTVHLVDVTPGAPQNGQEQARTWGYSGARGLYHCANYFTIAPDESQPLLAGHTYAAYLTTAIRGADGSPPAIEPDLAQVLGQSRPTGDAALAHAWDVHAPFRDYLTGKGIAPDTIADVAVFTVSDPVDPDRRLLQAVAAAPAPALTDLTLCTGGVTSPCEDASGRGACGPTSPDYYEIHGRYSVPIYQQGTPPYQRPADGGGIAMSGGVPVVQRTEDVCFALTIPKAGVMPAGGWPLVVFAHGTGGSFKNAIDGGVAGALAVATAPMAVFAYDGVEHGERKGDTTLGPDQLVFNLLNPEAARGNHEQGAVDVWQALKLPALGTVTLPGAGATSFDADRTYFFGHSQGSNVGLPAVALSGDLQAAVLSGAGAHLAQALLSKTSPVDARAGLELVVGEPLGLGHPIMVLWQTFYDPVDTMHFAPLLWSRPPAGVPAKDVFMSWGEGDTFSPQPTLAVTARTGRLPVAAPVIADLKTGTVARPVANNVSVGSGQSRTAACFQYPTDGYDGHFVAIENPTAVSDWLAFLTSLARTGTAEVP